MVTVWQFDEAGPRYRNLRGFRRCATQATIDRSGYVRLEGTAIELDARLLDNEGYTREDYLTFRLKIHPHALAGFSLGGARLQVMAGEYDARRTLREFNALVGGVPCIQLVGANQRKGGDLWVKFEEYPELDSFPEDQTRLDVLGSRVTNPEEI